MDSKTMLNFIDSHCHLQFPQYDNDREGVIKRALDGGVEMICVGTDLEMSKKAVELAEKNNGIVASIGIHPNDLKNEVKISDYESLLNGEKVVAIGEVGLDYYRTKGEHDRQKQRKILAEFFELAEKYDKPLIIHCRQAYDDMLEILSKHPKLKGVIHSFTSNWETAKKFIESGFLIGLNGIITFSSQYDDVVKNIPLNFLLLETDAPFLTPEPRRGKRNEPLYVKFVAEKIASKRGGEIEPIALNTKRNAEKLFKLSDYG